MNMKTLREVQDEILFGDEFVGGEVFTTEEFAELMKPTDDPEDNEIEFVDSFGYFHDGEQLTEIAVDPYTFDDYKDKYPYVVWKKI